MNATDVPSPDRVVSRDSIGRLLLDAASSAARRHGCHHLGHVPVLGRHVGLPDPLRLPALADAAWADAVSAEDAARIDADAVADWIVGHYPEQAYPAAVLGSPHGGAVHLASALGAPWLPTGFTVTVRWPGGSMADWGGALTWGSTVAEQILAANPTVTVRQVHDPLGNFPLCASTVTLHIRWRRLPAAYQEVLRDRMEPGAPSLVLRDIRTWPVVEVSAGHSFQVGSPVGGWQPDDYTTDDPSFTRLIPGRGDDRSGSPQPQPADRYAELAGEPALEPHLRQVATETDRPTRRVLYPGPETLSACVADVYRAWLHSVGRGGDQCVVETERLVDPWQVLTAGLVPYWCESASQLAVCGAEWWLAGSRGFNCVDVLPAPPGSAGAAHAGMRQWRALARFALHRGSVSHEAERRYPLYPLPTSHAAAMLHTQPRHEDAPPRLRMEHLLNELRRTGQGAGVLVL
jgi:hypothetical protein